MGLLTSVINEMDLKVGCFAGFCHHHSAITNACIHAYHSPLLESMIKSGL